MSSFVPVWLKANVNWICSSTTGYPVALKAAVPDASSSPPAKMAAGTSTTMMLTAAATKTVFKKDSL